MFGAVVLTAQVLPTLLEGVPLPMPLEMLMGVSLLQSAVLLGLMTWAGVALSPRLRLGAPLLEALAGSRPLTTPWRPRLFAGALGGVVGGLALALLARIAPPAVLAAQERFALPLLARVLYGGLTEEILLRWGVMTLLVWAGWRFIQKRQGVPARKVVWLGILGSALLFALGHLPAAATLVGSLTGPVVLYVVLANAAFGVLFGILYWRWGLEAAMLAHALVHVVGYVLA